MNELIILKEIFNHVQKNLDLIIQETPNHVKLDIDLLIDKIDTNKSLVSAIVTSLIKKISSPKQDIRLHRQDFENGYSARTLDTQVTTPFFKQFFPKYANKETAFLTLATRERIKWTKIDGETLKIRNKNLKNSFLSILDHVENNQIQPEIYLRYILAKMLILTKEETLIFQQIPQEIKGVLNINVIINMLSEHFNQKLASRLPVIAIYSIYQILINISMRYNNKYLKDLQVHTASDKKGFGDIEIYSNDGLPFEIVEIKHNIVIDQYLIFDIAKKTENTKINRYYLLTTYPNIFKNKEEAIIIQNFILEIKKNHNIDIIVNGIISTLKYYLRFIDNYQDFLDTYTKNLIKDAQNSTEIKNYHLENWIEIMKKY